MANLNFKKGLYENLPLSKVAGTVYITTDERAMYVDVSDTERIRIQGTVLYYDSLTQFTNEVKPPYSSDLVYFIANENAFVRWDPNKKNADGETEAGWIQLNATVDNLNTVISAVNANSKAIGELEEQIVDLAGKVGAPAEGTTAATGLFKEVADLKTSDIGLQKSIDELDGRLDTAEGDIGTLKNQTAEIPGIKTQVADLEAQIAGLDNKVDKEEGKGLSSNDFTDALLTKLNGIEAGATKTVIDSSLSSTSSNPVENKVVYTAIDALQEADSQLEEQLKGLDNKVDKVEGKGLSTNDFTNAFKTKLEGIEAGATKTIVDSSLSETSANPVQNSAVYAAISALQGADSGFEQQLTGINTALGNKVDKVTGKGLSTNDFTNDLKNKLDGIEAGATKTIVDDALSATSTNPVQNKVVWGISDAVSDLESQLGTLSGEVDKKVSKVDGKDLSSNDFTDALLAKLNGIEEGATKTVIDSTLSETSTNPVQNKVVWGLSQAVGDLEDQITGLDDKVDKVDGMGLSSNDFTDALLAKLNGIEAGATKTVIDDALSSTSTNPVQNKVVWGISDTVSKIEDQLEDVATKGELDAAKEELNKTITDEILAANAMTYKKGVGSAAELSAITNPSIGDTYVVTKAFGDYQAGDLLIATGTENASGVLETFTWTVVDTGYIEEHESKLTAEGNIISLTSYTNANLGQVGISGSDNVTITTTDNNINISMVWGEF